MQLHKVKLQNATFLIIWVVSTGIEPVSRVPETHVVSILLRDLNYFANIFYFIHFPWFPDILMTLKIK